MCGLAGILASRFEATTDSIITRMTAVLRHRGPDDSGIWEDAQTGIALGHRRLAVLDLSPAGRQPMLFPNGRYVLVFNGEIYNHLTLRRELESTGVVFAWQGHSDTETMLRAFEHWGVEETLRRAVGMFALALWDRVDQILTLARDRMGEKPLYYGWQGDTFLFGSELKALKAHPEFKGEIDRGALTLLLRHNYIPAPYSIYQGIHKLLPGTFLQLSLRKRDLEPIPYWSLAEVAERGVAHPFRGSDAQAIAGLEERLAAAVRSQMVADVPVGALLSGGVDSTAITALMQGVSSRAVRTFTVGFGEKYYDEAAHARAIAAHLGTDHTELQLSGGDALALVPQIPQMYDEPFADSSQLPTYLVMKMASQHVSVALSGDGGDELLGGYNRYSFAPRVWRSIQWMPEMLRRMLGAGLTQLPVEKINYLCTPLARHTGIAQPGDKVNKLGRRFREINSLDDLYVSLVSEWSRPEAMVVDGHMPSTLLDSRSQWPQLADPVARMMTLDGLTYLPDDILVKVDRAAMAVSLETRAPFLDQKVLEYSWSLPMQQKVRDGQGKWLLKSLVDRHVPGDLMDRPKMGFGVPLDTWLRGPLREWAQSLLSEERLRREGYFHPESVCSAWDAHVSGRASNGYRLWSILMFQAWLESNV